MHPGPSIPLSVEEAVKMMPDSDHIATIRDMNYPSTYARKTLIQRFKDRGVELSGPRATSLGFGLASWDRDWGWLFIETTTDSKTENSNSGQNPGKTEPPAI